MKKTRKRYFVVLLLLLIIGGYIETVEYVETKLSAKLPRIVARHTEESFSMGKLELKPIRGHASIDTLMLKSPGKGVAEATCRRLTVSYRPIASLLSREIKVTSIRVKDFKIKVSREVTGEIKGPGLNALTRILTDSASEFAGKPPSRKSPPVDIARIVAKGQIDFTDLALSEDVPFEGPLTAEIEINHFSAKPDGRISTKYWIVLEGENDLKMSVSGDTNIDPALDGPDVTLSGTIDSIPAVYLKTIASQGIMCESAGANIEVKAVEGEIEKANSHIILSLDGLSYSGEAATIIPVTQRSMPTLGLKVKLQGPITSPQADLATPLSETLNRVLSDGNELTDAAKTLLSPTGDP